jgi:hypothetical protein
MDWLKISQTPPIFSNKNNKKSHFPYQREKLLASKGAIAYNTIYMVRVVVAITPYTFYSLF